MTAYVVVTAHDTVLFVTADGGLTHRPASDAVLNLIVDEAANVVHAPFGAAGVLVPFQRVDAEDGSFSLYRDKAGWLSAQFGGELTLQAVQAGWEMFRLVDIESVRDRLAALAPSVPGKPRGARIPRIIHQTYASPSVPPNLAANVDALRALNPDWQYRYWSDKLVHDFIYSYYGWDVLRSYLRINPRYGAARADLFRYLCLYQFGGVYLDIKSSCRQPLDEFIRDDDVYILSQWHHFDRPVGQREGIWPELSSIPGGEYQQWHIIAAPGHPFLAAVLERVLRNISRYNEVLDGVGGLGTLRVTGPIAYTLAIAPIKQEHEHRQIEPEGSPLIYYNVDINVKRELSRYGMNSTPLVL